MSEQPKVSQSPKTGSPRSIQQLFATLLGAGTYSDSTTVSADVEPINTDSTKPIDIPSLPYHICGIRNRKTRLDNSSTSGSEANRKSIITTISMPPGKEKTTIGILRKKVEEELDIPSGCEVKLFYGGMELEKNSHSLLVYVLEQDRDLLFEPHIVVALKEGRVVKVDPPKIEETKEEEKKMETKEEEKKMETTPIITINTTPTNIVPTTTTTTTTTTTAATITNTTTTTTTTTATATATTTTTTLPTATGIWDSHYPELTAMLNRRLGKVKVPPPVPMVEEQRLKAYQNFEIKYIKAKDPVHLEECEDCYQLPVCGHGICGDSLYHYAWNSVKEKKELSVRCPYALEEKKENPAVCGQVVPFLIVKKILSHYFKTKQDKTDLFEDALEKMFMLEVLLCENFMHDRYDVQKCKTCQSILFRELKPDKTANIQFKSLCPVCTSDKEWQIEASKQVPKVEKRRSSVLNRIFCTTDTSEKVEETNKEKTESKETPTTVTATPTVDPTPTMNPTTTTTTTTTTTATTVNQPILNLTPPDNSTDIKIEVKAPEPPPVPKVERSPVDHMFCWPCGNPWKDLSSDFCGNEHCQTKMRADIIVLLTSCTTKKVGQVDGVPELRGCPTCGMLVNHTEACKHMTCRCQAAFCFVCMKPKLKTGTWQCGASSDICPVYKRQAHEDLPTGNRSVVNLFSLIEKK